MATSKLSGFSYFSCGRRDRVSCSSHDCSRPGMLVCTHPVKRDGEPGHCKRAVCERCATLVDGNVLCAPHARAAQAGAK